MTKQRSGRKKMKPWRSWGTKNGDGTPGRKIWPTKKYAEMMAAGTGFSVVRVLVTELRTKRKGKR